MEDRKKNNADCVLQQTPLQVRACVRRRTWALEARNLALPGVLERLHLRLR
jgi:hypothetical protein